MADHADYKVIADLTDHIADASAHHVKFTAAEARAAINDIFGSDGKADADIDLDGHDLKGGNVVLPDGSFIGIGAALERLEFYTAGYAAFMGCDVGIGTTTPQTKLDVKGAVNIGIATFNPAYQLLVRADPTVSYPLVFQNKDGVTSWYIDNLGNVVQRGSFVAQGVGASSIAGSLGIGTTTPTTGRLVVANGSLDVAAHDAATVGLKLGGTLLLVTATEVNFLNNVSYGDDDSGGAGFKVLRVPN